LLEALAREHLKRASTATLRSNNRDKARIKVARANARVADARREFHHQLSTRLIRENQAIAVEDLAVSGLARTRLAKVCARRRMVVVRGRAGVRSRPVRAANDQDQQV
jgi:transposase